MKKINFTKNDIKMLIVAIISAILESIALTSFITPGGFIPAGLSGIVRMISIVFEETVDPQILYSILYFSINLLLAIIVFKHIGKRFTIYTLLQTTLVSLFSSKMVPLFSVDNNLLLAIFGGIINGASCGLALAYNFSSGGTDYLNVYFSSKYNRSIINYVLAFNVCLISVFGILYGWEHAMISIIYQYCTTQVVKTLHKRYTHDTITIITKSPEKVSEAIMKDIRHGITINQGKGAYKNETQYTLYTVVNSFQTQTVVNAARSADEDAFINITPSIKVVGNYYQLPLD